jgi:hypothetical protein
MRKRKSPINTKIELAARVNVLRVKNMREKPVIIIMQEMM